MMDDLSPVISATFVPLERREDHGPFVYFIRWGEYVKIGTSINPERRLNEIGRFGSQTVGPPAPLGDPELVACVPGSAHHERLWHRQFSSLRTTGEWFLLDDALREAIASAVGVHIRTEMQIAGVDEHHPAAHESFLRRLPMLDRLMDEDAAHEFDEPDA